MQTEMMTFPIGDTSAPGYLAVPEGADALMGVVVIQEWWGLNSHIQDVTRRVAEAGAVALAPDLYHGQVAVEPDEARKQAMSLDRERAIREIDAAVAFLKSHPQVASRRIGIVGFCMGGGLALQAGARNPDVGAVVAFYGGWAPSAADITNTQVAILNIVGENDEHVKQTQRKLEQDLRMTPVQHDLVIYPGVGHAFFNDTRPEVYNVGAATDAWARAIDWLRSHLAVRA
jgi:carboxymethylenebutenolidase